MLIANITGYGILKSRISYPNLLQKRNTISSLSQSPKTKTLKIESERVTVMNSEKYDQEILCFGFSYETDGPQTYLFLYYRDDKPGWPTRELLLCRQLS